MVEASKYGSETTVEKRRSLTGAKDRKVIDSTGHHCPS
jgi:hypothetical protein